MAVTIWSATEPGKKSPGRSTVVSGLGSSVVAATVTSGWVERPNCHWLSSTNTPETTIANTSPAIQRGLRAVFSTP